MDKKRYCLGKASHYRYHDIVKVVPFRSKGTDVRDLMRSRIYDDEIDALTAAFILSFNNPVEYVVLIYEGESDG